jgi:hypothetical protein
LKQGLQGAFGMNVNKPIFYYKHIRRAVCVMLWGFACLAGQVAADAMQTQAGQRFNNWGRATDSELDQLRGGFVLPNGIMIDLSIQRIIALNDVIVSSSFSQLPGNGPLVQNGDLNHASDLAISGLGSVIQNSLDNQTIQNLTQINLAVSNIKNLQPNMGSMLLNSLILSNK